MSGLWFETQEPWHLVLTIAALCQPEKSVMMAPMISRMQGASLTTIKASLSLFVYIAMFPSNSPAS